MASDLSRGPLYGRAILSVVRLVAFLLIALPGIAIAKSLLLSPYRYSVVASSDVDFCSLLLLHSLYQLFEVGGFHFFGVMVYSTPNRRRIGYLAKGLMLAWLASSLIPQFQRPVMLVLAAFAVVLLASLLADYTYLQLFHRTSLERTPAEIRFSKIRADFNPEAGRIFDALFSWILFPLLVGSTLLSLASSTLLFGLDVEWPYGAILVLAILLAFLSTLIYWSSTRSESKPTGKTIAAPVVLPSLTFLIAWQSPSHPLLLLAPAILTHFGVVGVVLCAVALWARRELMKTTTYPRDQMLKMAFHFTVVLTTLALVSGLFYYLTGIGPVE